MNENVGRSCSYHTSIHRLITPTTPSCDLNTKQKYNQKNHHNVRNPRTRLHLPGHRMVERQGQRSRPGRSSEVQVPLAPFLPCSALPWLTDTSCIIPPSLNLLRRCPPRYRRPSIRNHRLPRLPKTPPTSLGEDSRVLALDLEQECDFCPGLYEREGLGLFELLEGYGVCRRSQGL
jgi:hypothetical protein